MADDVTQHLQNTVDKAKTLSTMNNIHHLSPPTKKDDNEHDQIAIIKSLSSDPRVQGVYFEAQGLAMVPGQKDPVKISEPIMNREGAMKLFLIIRRIAQEAEWGNFHEDDIPKYMDHFFRQNYPYFTFWHTEYELDPRNFNYVETTIQMFLLGSFSKGKGGKYINVVGKTYSEDFLGKVFPDEKSKRREGILDRLNPLRRV